MHESLLPGALPGYGTPFTDCLTCVTRNMLALQGLAHCFERGEDGGRLQDVFVIEPVSANSLECMVAGGCRLLLEPASSM